jgi:mono/diheme cytochrome c family protein
MTVKTLMMISLALVGCSNGKVPEEAQPRAKAADPVERGKHLVITSGCHDCHTPFKLGPKGAEPDFSRALSGHPAQLVMPPAPELPPGPWLMSVAATNTAWAGPWGVSFTANLTPDKETGLGTWSQETFVATIRNAKHQGVGRPLLPPMPAAFLAQMPDEDLGAIYAYLRTVPAINNPVPTPVPPKTAAMPTAANKQLARQ